MQRDQRIRDPVHNLIKFSKESDDDVLLWRLIQTSPFQRLRRIKQLGFSDFVFPGASHTRFSHSIGAMQMARRMIAVLERNDVFQAEIRKHELSRRATLAAALLHDVGHGPFSHVFEEVSRNIGITKHHVQYTLDIINNSEISDLLEEAGVLEKILSLFSAESGSTAYSNIISSQMDADRLDFLVRDRYFTGVRSVAIDLEWLFDGLDIAQVPAEIDSPAMLFTFYIKPKAMSAVEEYLSSYSKMYSNVYFHKTTRGIQYLVQDILMMVLEDEGNKTHLSNNHPFLRYFEEPSLTAYLNLDDMTVLDVIKQTASANLGEVSALSQRFLDRKLYKCFQPPKRPHDTIPRGKVSRFVDRMNKNGIFHHRDMAPPKGYKQHDIMGEEFVKNILVHSEYDNDYKPIAELSPAVGSLAEKNPLRFYFRNEDDHTAAREIWDSLA